MNETMKIPTAHASGTRKLATFPNPAPQRDTEIHFTIPEFTCVCPLTGQPDFATIRIRYIPDKLCVELKSLKLYFWSFRDDGAFHEAVTHQFLTDLSELLKPRYIEIIGDFNVRGGIHTVVIVRHTKKSWRPDESLRAAGWPSTPWRGND